MFVSYCVYELQINIRSIPGIMSALRYSFLTKLVDCSAVTPQYVISTYCLSLRPFHTWLRLLSPHILYSTHSTLCLFKSYHHSSLCWCFTLIVNPLLTTIAHHIFSSVLAGISLISILWHYHDDGVHRELSECEWCLVNRCERHWVKVTNWTYQMLKMKSQHRKQGNREHVLYVQYAVCIVRTVYSTCKWDRIVRTVVQYVLWCHNGFSKKTSVKRLSNCFA